MNRSIVVWDPSGKWPQGEVVEPEQGADLTCYGGIVLPYDERGDAINPIGSLHIRSLGKGVWFKMVPERLATLALYVSGYITSVHWRMRLQAATHAVPSGMVRMLGLVSPGIQRPPSEGAAVNLTGLGLPDANDGWTIGGSINVPLVGFGGYMGLQFVCGGSTALRATLVAASCM
jgi:hypothetical protein